MATDRGVEQNVIILGTNASEVAAAVSLITGKIHIPIQKAEHPNLEYPHTYCVWETNGIESGIWCKPAV